MAATDADLPLWRSALDPIDLGPLLRVASGQLTVDIAPQAGGRLASVRWRGVEWLLGHRPETAMINWGSYPMLPWAGRLRHGRFSLAGHPQQLPCNFGRHALHGLGFYLPWQARQINEQRVELRLDLPCDSRWPFGGRALQVIEVEGDALSLQLSVTADQRMPCVIGWHPWFLKPEQLQFAPFACYPRDGDGVATAPPQAPPPPPPWDDCFLNQRPVLLQRSGQQLQLTSDCHHWVVYDERPDATCVEPQTGPPDAFNIEPREHLLAPGETRSAWMRWQWLGG